ncbi:MAG: heme biosynthesis protein HemY [Azoarcus sp.]|jgi:HemY protein|nr:heme biosynthesis protein HemY [Azoarcus sp.]
MRILIGFIALFAIAVGLAMLFSHDWGYAQFVVTVPQWPRRVQMSLKTFALLLLVVFFVAYLFVRLIRRALALPEAFGQWRERRRRQRADRSLRESLLAFYEGRYAKALKAAEKAYAASDHPVTAVLLAARAAHAMRDEPRYRVWIERLVDEGENAQVARLMTEAEMAILSHDFMEAAGKLETLRQDGHRHIAALRLSLQVETALQHWDEVLRLTRQLRKHKALTVEQTLPLLRRAHIECLREQSDDCEALVEVWNAIPSDERADRQLVAEAVPLLARAGKGHLVRRTLERLLDDEWDSGLARLYSYCGDEGACLAKGEDWLQEHSRDAGLLFALGRLCVLSRLWGKAESYFTASLGLCPDIETHLALARLFDRLERREDTQKHYRAAAEMAAG